MSLSEIMRNADLSVYPKVGLIIFLGVFLMVCYRTMRMKRTMDVRQLANLALEEDAPVNSTQPAGKAP